MSAVRVLSTKCLTLQDGLLQLSVDTGQASSLHHTLRMEVTWKENVRQVRQEGVRYGSLPIILDGLLTHLVDPEEALRRMSEMIKTEAENNFQVFEIVDFGNSEKSNKNKLAALINKTRSDGSIGGCRRVFYSLVVFECNLGNQTANVIRVDVHCEVTPNNSESGQHLTNIQMLRWRALLALEPDLRQPPVCSASLMASVTTWRLSSPPPALVIDARPVPEMKLETAPETSRAASGVIGVKMIITEMANCGERGEKEILTRLEDEVVLDEKWETKMFHVWTVPKNGKVQYSLLLFYKGGLVYKSTVKCVFSKCGDSDVIFLNRDHLEMLKLVNLKKLKEDYPDVKARMVLPGGLDVNRVTLPVILTSNQGHDQQSTAVLTPEKTKKNKTAGLFGMFKSLNSSSEQQQEPNNATEISRGPSASIPSVSISTELPPPRLQRQNTLIHSDPKNFQAILSKEMPEASANSNLNLDNNKETLKVPVADLFPDKLQEQNYSRRKRTTSDKKVSEGEARKKSPVRKFSTCLEPHEPVIDSLPAPVPVSPAPRPSLSRNVSICSTNSSFDTFNKQSGILDRRNTLVAFKDAISESGRKLSLMVSDNQQRALESLLADIQGAAMSPRRKALYSLLFFMGLVILYWTGLALADSFLALRENLTGHLDRMSALHDSQMYDVNKRLEAIERTLMDKMQGNDVSEKLESVLALVKEGAEGNTLKMTVMDRLVAELGGIETAIVALQDQVTKGLNCGWFSDNNE